MNRREFLSASARLAASSLLPVQALAQDGPRDLRITRIVGFDLRGRRPKFVGKNSKKGDHGGYGGDPMARLFTNAGLEGLGRCGAREETLADLLGKNPLDFFKPQEPAFRSPLGLDSMPLWDLAGRALGKPVYELLGGKGAGNVPVYDGSIYFADLLPQYADRPLDRFKEEIDLGLRRGHRAFKVKIGRGAKWMPAEEGYARDKEVLRTIRRHAGPDVLIGVDANDGYGLARTIQLLTDLPDVDLAFLEEMFPEKVDECLELKAFLAGRKLKTLVADGEGQREPAPFKPLMEARAIDIYQGDMNRFGFEGILEEAAMARPQGQLVAPHNWGSLMGFFKQLHVALAIPNFYRAEQDMMDTDVLVADGYAVRDGLATVPGTPGFGLKIDEKSFAAEVRPKFDLKL